MRIALFPGSFDPAHNADAFMLFARDVERLCRYFARYGVRVDASHLARDIWSRSLPELAAEMQDIP